MQILQRMRYILEVWKPAATVVIQILQILTRIARHSTQSAYEVSASKNCIFEKKSVGILPLAIIV